MEGESKIGRAIDKTRSRNWVDKESKCEIEKGRNRVSGSDRESLHILEKISRGGVAKESIEKQGSTEKDAVVS